MHKYTAYNHPYSAVPPTPQGPPSPELDFTNAAKVEEFIRKAFKAGAQQPASPVPSSVTKRGDSPGARPGKRAADSGSDSDSDKAPAAKKPRDPETDRKNRERSQQNRDELRRAIVAAGTAAKDLNGILDLRPTEGAERTELIDRLIAASKIAGRRIVVAQRIMGENGLLDRFMQEVLALETPTQPG